MDKETLSNYGWIVICVLVLAVMIALATPFGNFIAGAIKSTTAGFFGVNQNALNSTGLINIGDQSFSDGGNGGAGGTNTLPEVGKTAEEYTWADIKAISESGKGDEYFSLGDTKTFTTTDGKTIVMEIVAFNADTKSDGTGTAGITWISKNFLGTYFMSGTEGIYGNQTTEGGWESSVMRSWLQESKYETLPEEVKLSIVEVDKTYFEYDSGNNSTKTCSDKIWIPSYREIIGGTNYETDGADYTNYFDSKEKRIKYNSSDEASTWWLRSTSTGMFGQITFECISWKGGASDQGSNCYLYVVLGFCT